MSTTMTATEARANLYRLIDQAAESHQSIRIAGKRSSAALISEADWDAIQETLYLASIPGMRDSRFDAGLSPTPRESLRVEFLDGKRSVVVLSGESGNWPWTNSPNTHLWAKSEENGSIRLCPIHQEDQVDFTRLQVFIHVAELESITKTANMLNTTQSAISRHVNALEREFGGRLFHRTGRGVRLSELGMRVEPRVRTVLAEIERIGAEAKAFAGVPTGEVFVGILPSLAPYISVALFGQVRRHFPEIRLRLVDGFSGQLEGQLVDGQLDMALLFRYSGRSTPADELIAPLHSYLIGPKGDRLTETEKVDFADLKGIPLVVPTFPNGLRVALDEEARRHDFKLSIVLEVSSTPVQLAIVQEEREPVYAISSYYAAAEAIRLGHVQASQIDSTRVDRQLVLTMSERRPSSLATRTIKKAISDLSAALAALEPPMDGIKTC